MTTEEMEIKHKWMKGEWLRKDKGDRYLTRDDKCELCGCERTLIKVKRDGKIFQWVVIYVRSHQVYGHENMPECWGAKNP